MIFNEVMYEPPPEEQAEKRRRGTRVVRYAKEALKHLTMVREHAADGIRVMTWWMREDGSEARFETVVERVLGGYAMEDERRVAIERLHARIVADVHKES